MEFSSRCTAKQNLSILHFYFAGKFIENSRLYTHVDLIHSLQSIDKFLLNPYYQSTQIINENLVAVLSKPPEIPLNKPYAVGNFFYFIENKTLLCSKCKISLIAGFSILELSKRYMLHLYHDIFMPFWGRENIGMLFTDTGTLS